MHSSMLVCRLHRTTCRPWTFWSAPGPPRSCIHVERDGTTGCHCDWLWALRDTIRMNGLHIMLPNPLAVYSCVREFFVGVVHEFEFLLWSVWAGKPKSTCRRPGRVQETIALWFRQQGVAVGPSRLVDGRGRFALCGIVFVMLPWFLAAIKPHPYAL